MPATRKNHYVPIWYQKRFLPVGEKTLFYLNLNPDQKTLPNGRVVRMNDCYQWGPKNCFVQRDLYTTMFFGMPNDDIEKYLFGSIDTDGSIALQAVLANDYKKLHKFFLKFFEYLDAQKLRTPKGLDWIKSHYQKLTQVELMHEMQHLRRMHCTMWVEGVREIVSAEDSSIKFIITDQPVTIFNPACPPNSIQCKYPNDPSIVLKASQTIFPLDLDHCLILTNLEYARSPDSVDMLSKRTHARYFGETLARWDTMIRTRKLNEEEVTTINFILKHRARKFIGAAQKEWLFPENKTKIPWLEMGQVLLPPNNELHHFGGEILVGYENGATQYQDEFGRSYRELTHLKKEPIKGKIGRNDQCPCGNGRKYKDCCSDKAKSERPSWAEYSIRERNLLLFNGIANILGLSTGKTWEDVRREISDEQVSNIYKVVASLWPLDTNLFNLLPHPDSSRLRALYAGVVDPRVILRNVVGFSFYADEIIIISPFINPSIMKKEYSPIHSPNKYKLETIKSVFLLIQLFPLIDSGIVNMIPDPCDFDHLLRKKIYKMAKDRSGQVKLNKKDFETFELLQKEDVMRTLWSLPEDIQKQEVRKVNPRINEEEINQVIKNINKMRLQDPLALLQPIIPSEEGAQLQKISLNLNLELGLFLAQVTGSFIYTDSRYTWGELLKTTQDNVVPQKANWDFVTKKLSNLNLIFLNAVDPRKALAIRQSGKLGSIRIILRQVWTTLHRNIEPEKVDVLTKGLVDNLMEAHKKLQSELPLVQKELQDETKDPLESLAILANGKFDCKIPPNGFGENSVRRLLLSHSGRTNYLSNLPMALFIEFD